MAESLVFEVLEKLSSLIYEEVSLLKGVRGELEKLQSNLRAIQAVLSDAENRQWKEAVVKLWLDKLKDVSYDIDDVLDEWSTAILKGEIDDKSDKRSSFCLLPSCFFSCYEIPFRYDISDKIISLNARLDAIASEKKRYSFNQLIVANEQLVERRITTSVVNMAEVKGRGVEKQKIVDKLLGESSQTRTLSVISLVGMGGIGKTTLAKLVYNDDDVKVHFAAIIWVCVSHPFDEIRVAKAILESLTGVSSNLVELQNILEKIHQSISGKKFLLVLDDVWIEDGSKWDQLKCSLLSGSPGSRILATTRKENVAKTLGCTESDIFPIGQLSKDESWSLFSQIVFAECTGKNCEQLEGICREIVAKCKGLPLAIRMLGSLCSGKSRTDLQSILVSEVWELEEAEVDLFPHVLLSYYDLPSALKRCFSYCAIFPKDYRIEKHKLIESWMALGFLRATSREDMEKIGENYFQKLAMCSLLQDYEVDRDDGSIIACYMHDIVHDFALFITKNECFFMEAIGSEETRIESCPKEARYARLIVADGAPLLNLLSGLKKLRSFQVQCSPSVTISGAQLTYLFENLSLLRSLDLSNCFISEIPSAICKLVHLRQLDLSLNFQLWELPETVCELVNLQTLNVYGGSDGFTALPHGIGKLMQLRHLHFSPNLMLPKGVGSLTRLRTLTEFRLGYDDADFSLADLEKLNHLQGKLSITGLNGEVDVMAAKQAKLKSKTQIIFIILRFTEENAESRKHHDKEITEELEPSPNLECLSLYEYQGSVFPSWLMSLAHLKKLDLYSCSNCENLPSLGKLPSLESLYLSRLIGVKKVGLNFLGMEPHTDNKTPAPTCSNVAFPKLTQLSFIRMDGLEEWDDEDTSSSIVMPSLQSLIFVRCHSLRALPGHIFRRVRQSELNLTVRRCSNLTIRYQQDFSDLPNVYIW